MGVSETILGLPFEREPPAYAPIDEEHPARPESSYALSKLLAEELGRQLYRSTGTPYVALRFSNIMEPQDYERFPSFWGDSRLRRWNLWGYIDARDVAQSCRLALNGDVGAEHFIVAAADTVMNRPSAELMADGYPSVTYRPTQDEFDTLLSIEKARKLLGYEPKWSWRDHIAAGAAVMVVIVVLLGVVSWVRQRAGCRSAAGRRRRGWACGWSWPRCRGPGPRSR